MILEEADTRLIVDGRGVYFVKIEATCDRLNYSFRMRLEMTAATGQNIQSDQELATEIFTASRRMNFEFRITGAQSMDRRGVVDLSSRPPGPYVKLNRPSHGTVRLPKNTMLMNEYLEHLVQNLKKNATRVSTLVFTGSEPEIRPSKYIDTVLDMEPDRRLVAYDSRLASMRAWHVRSAVFDGDQDLAMPLGETEFIVYANGMVDPLSMDLGVVKFRLDLVDLVHFPRPRCNP